MPPTTPALPPLSWTHLLGICRFGRFPSPLVFDLLHAVGGAAAFWSADVDALTDIGLNEKLARDFAAWRTGFSLDVWPERLDRHGIIAVTIDQPEYPERLRQITDPPPLLFVRGNVEALRTSAPLAVVGTRRLTEYGQLVVSRLVRPTAAAGATIVSGLALGVDAAAHAAALEVGGLTVAVLGSGIDPTSVAPRTNADLAENIVAAGGALVAEYPPGTTPFKDHFPARNRIIAGLSLGVLVIEAAEKSGSLITAARALDYNRDVLAVPGPIQYPNAAGPNELIRRGATPCFRPEHLLEYLQLTPQTQSTTAVALNPTATGIIKRLTRGPAALDQLQTDLNLPISAILSEISQLEISGRVCQSTDGLSYYIDNPSPLRLPC